jgi:hypothetical protein
MMKYVNVKSTEAKLIDADHFHSTVKALNFVSRLAFSLRLIDFPSTIDVLLLLLGWNIPARQLFRY